MLRHVWGADFLCLCSGSIRLLQVSQRWTQNPQRGKQPVKVNAPSNLSCRIIYLYLFVWIRRRKNIRLNLCSIFSVLSPAVSKCTAVWSVCCFINVVKLCGLNSVHCYEAWWLSVAEAAEWMQTRLRRTPGLCCFVVTYGIVKRACLVKGVCQMSAALQFIL